MTVTRVRRGSAGSSVQIAGDLRAPLGLHVSATAESAAHPLLPLAPSHVLNSDHECKQSRPEVDLRLAAPCAHHASASWRVRPSCHASAHQGGLTLSTRTSSPLASTSRTAPTQQSLCGLEAANTPSLCDMCGSHTQIPPVVLDHPPGPACVLFHVSPVPPGSTARPTLRPPPAWANGQRCTPAGWARRKRHPP